MTTKVVTSKPKTTETVLKLASTHPADRYKATRDPLVPIDVNINVGETWMARITKKVYKFLNNNGVAHQNFHWPLPKNDKPGRWVEVQGTLETCKNGLHVTDETRAHKWGNDTCYEVEIEGGGIDSGDKITVRKARLIREVPGYKALRANRYKTNHTDPDRYTDWSGRKTTWERYRTQLQKSISGKPEFAPLLRLLVNSTTYEKARDAIKGESLQIKLAQAEIRLDNAAEVVVALKNNRKPVLQLLPKATIKLAHFGNIITPTIQNMAILQAGGTPQPDYWTKVYGMDQYVPNWQDLAKKEWRLLHPIKEATETTSTKMPEGIRRAAIN